MPLSIENRLNLCSDIEFFTHDNTIKYYLRLKIEPDHLETSWYHAIYHWDVQPDMVTPYKDSSVVIVTKDLGYTILNLCNFCHLYDCFFIGEHYQYPTNRIIRTKITANGSEIIDYYQGGPNNYKAFKNRLEKKFDLKISPNALSRISAEDYPDEMMYKHLIEETITFRHRSHSSSYIKRQTKNKKQKK